MATGKKCLALGYIYGDGRVMAATNKANRREKSGRFAELVGVMIDGDLQDGEGLRRQINFGRRC
jgi:hypothetical protein